MGSVWVGQIGCYINLVGCYVGKQRFHQVYVTFGHGELFYAATLVERQFQEVDMVALNAIIGASQTCLATADERLHTAYFLRVHVAFLFLCQEVFHGMVALGDDVVVAIGENGVETIGEMHEAHYLFVAYGNVTRRLIGYVNIVTLLHQSANGTTHGDDVIVRMRREHHYALRVGQCTLWAV